MVFEQAHLVHRTEPLLTWCGRPIDIERYYSDTFYYYDTRTSKTNTHKCADCRRYEAHYKEGWLSYKEKKGW